MVRLLGRKRWSSPPKTSLPHLVFLWLCVRPLWETKGSHTLGRGAGVHSEVVRFQSPSPMCPLRSGNQFS